MKDERVNTSLMLLYSMVSPDFSFSVSRSASIAAPHSRLVLVVLHGMPIQRIVLHIIHNHLAAKGFLTYNSVAICLLMT
jgi:hypothetical protein